MRVLLFQTQQLQTLTVTSPRGFKVLDLKTRVLLLKCGPGEKLYIAAKGFSLHLRGSRAQDLPAPICLENGNPSADFLLSTPSTPERPYPGFLEIRNQTQYLQVINQISEAAYLHSTVANEMPAAWPAEALKAQAVLARTYLAHNRGRHGEADFCDLAHCQVYKGRSRDPQVSAALQATDNLILIYHGHAIDAVFHSACGGKTAAAQDIWPNAGNTPYLPAAPDTGPLGDYCQDSPDHDWWFDISPERLAKQLKTNGVSMPASLSEIHTTIEALSERVIQVQLVFADGNSVSLTGDDFYRAWGQNGNWHQLKSTWFTVEKPNRQFHFQGHGLGHGVGLCQWGARGRALAGKTYAEILKHYFPGTALEKEK